MVSSAIRSPSAIVATAWSACACRSSIRRSGATRSRMRPTARWSGATSAATSSAFNMVHRSGIEGWMGPLAVRTEYQGSGTGKEIVERGVDGSSAQARDGDRSRDDAAHDGQHRLLFGARFHPGPLTITLTLDAAQRRSLRRAARPPERARPRRRAARSAPVAGAAAWCRATTIARDRCSRTTLSLGDTVLLRDGGTLVGFALATRRRSSKGGRARSCACSSSCWRAMRRVRRDDPDADATTRGAAERGASRSACRASTRRLYQQLIALGGRVRWTDLRMALGGYEEPPSGRGLVLSNWEI